MTKLNSRVPIDSVNPSLGVHMYLWKTAGQSDSQKENAFMCPSGEMCHF